MRLAEAQIQLRQWDEADETVAEIAHEAVAVAVRRLAGADSRAARQQIDAVRRSN